VSLPGWSGVRYRRSLASRVTLLATLAVGLSVTVVAFAAYATVRSQTLRTLDDSLHSRAVVAARTDPIDVLGGQSVPSWALGAANIKIAFLDLHSGVQFNPTDNGPNGALPLGNSEAQVAARERTFSARTIVLGSTRYRMVAVPAGAQGQALVIAQSLEPTDRMLQRLGLVMLLFGLAGMIAAGLAGWAVARNGLRPVRRLTTAVEEIARTEQLDPIPVEGNDEVARLAMAFNQMLASLSASRTRQRQLVADAGHELRTPLTSLRTNLDLLVQADASTGLSAADRTALLDDVRAQISELSTLVGDLVELAREDPIGPTVAPVDLADVVRQAVSRVRRRAGTLTFEVRAESWWVTGDPAALERAVTNLLDNAVKWSPDQGTVRVELVDGTVMVADQGKGIAPRDLPHVFDRFYRSAESRGMPGSGLGLSIVRAVAERHGGVVRAGDGPGGGAAFWFSVPGTRDSDELLVGS
jgi:two-component system, OmpR family, sensor histidine kinase MprB